MLERYRREARRRWVNRAEERRRQEWPDTPADGTVTAISVNYNTLVVTLQMIFSLYRVLEEAPAQLIIVDNGSSDGSAEFLEQLELLGLIGLVRNTRSNQHGPGLNLGLEEAIRRTPHAELVWVVDSDVFVARPDALADARSHLAKSGCSLIGPRDVAAADATLPEGYAHVSCLLFNPRRVWHAPVSVFHDHGDPGRPMQASLRRLGDPAAFFPFYEQGYAVHLGRATLMRVAESRERSNPLYEWALTHDAHHYAGYALGPTLHDRIARAMQAEVGQLSPERFVEACRRPSRIALLED